MRFHFGNKLLAAGLLAAALTACGVQSGVGVVLPTAQPAPATVQPAPATAQPTAQATSAPVQPTLQPGPGGQQPTAQPALKPAFSFEPRGGGPGTTVTVRGWGYQPGTWIGVYLGTPGPVGTAMASAQASAQGAWETRVTIPAHLPSGAPVPASNIFLVTMNDRFQPLASASFGYVAPPPPAEQPLPPLSQAREVAQTIIVAAGTAPVERFMARPMRDHFLNGRGYEWLMGFDPYQITGKPEVGEPQLSGRVARIAVMLPYATERRYFSFDMVVEEGTWKVAGSTFQRSEPVVQIPPINTAPAVALVQADAAAISQLMLAKLRPSRPGTPILVAAVAGAGDYALGVGRPMGEMDQFFYYKREGGTWREVLMGGPTTRDVLVSNGIPVSLEVPQPIFGVVMGTFGYYNGGSGGPADGYVTIDRVADGHARATVHDGAQGPITVYLRLDAMPVVLIAGQVFAPEALDQLGIPTSVR